MLLSRLIIISLFLTVTFNEFQGQSFYKKYGTQGNDYAESVVMDRDSGFVIVGGTEGIGQGGMDGYFLKIDSAGNLLYTRTFGGGEIDRLTDIKVNPAGFAISGYSNSFGLDYDMYVLQTDPQGIIIWEKVFGGTSWDFANAIDILPNGSIIVAGESYTYSNGLSDGYVINLDPLGDTIWTKHFGGAGKDVFNDVVCTPDGNILLIGTLTNSNNDKDFWLMYLDSNGNELWSLVYGDSLNQEAMAGAILLEDEFVITGNSETNTGTFIDNIFIKVKNTGVVSGSNVINDVADDYGTGVVSYHLDSSFVLVGYGNSIGNGGFDGRVFDCGYNTYGIYDFDYQIGNSFDDYIYAADTTYDKGLIVVGTTNETAYGFTSIFVNKVDSSTVPVTVFQEEVDLVVQDTELLDFSFYPNPVKNELFFKNSKVNGQIASIHSLDGKVVLTTKITNQQMNVPESITGGIYLMSIGGNCFKLVIE